LRILNAESRPPTASEDQPFGDVEGLTDEFEVSSHFVNGDVHVVLHVVAIGSDHGCGLASAPLVDLNHKVLIWLKEVSIDSFVISYTVARPSVHKQNWNSLCVAPSVVPK